MKTLCLFILMAVFSPNVSMASGDNPVNLDKLPVKAAVLVNFYFKEYTVTSIVRKLEGIEVRLTRGVRLFFDRKGNWREVDCSIQSIPTPMIPSSILNQISEEYGPYTEVVCAYRSPRGMLVKLQNGMQMKFNRRNKQVDYNSSSLVF